MREHGGSPKAAQSYLVLRLSASGPRVLRQSRPRVHTLGVQPVGGLGCLDLGRRGLAHGLHLHAEAGPYGTGPRLRQRQRTLCGPRAVGMGHKKKYYMILYYKIFFFI